jgi:hypothetical protein
LYGAVWNFKLENGKRLVFFFLLGLNRLRFRANPELVPIEKHMVMNVTYRKSPNNGATWPFLVYLNDGVNPELPSNGTFKKTLYGDWYYVELTVPASKDISDEQWQAGNQYAVAWAGCPQGAGSNVPGIVYIDDIRFYPRVLFATSNYYEQKWFKPIVSVDANNNPGNKIVYDDFGRVSEIRKLDKNNITNTTLLKSVEYNIPGQLTAGEEIKLLYPDYSETFNVDDKINIRCVNRSEGVVSIWCVNYLTTAAVETRIHSERFPAGYNEWNWTIPQSKYGKNKIKVIFKETPVLSREMFNVNITGTTRW